MQRQKNARRTLLDGSVAAGLGVALFVLSSIVSRIVPYGQAGGTIFGWPIPYTSFIPNCPPFSTNPFMGCGLAYNPFLIAADYGFWFALSLGFVFTSEIIWMRHGKHTILESKTTSA